MIYISQTYERWTPDDIEAGDTDNKGFHMQDEAVSFAELVDLMTCHREASNSHNDGNINIWLTDLTANEGTQECYEEYDETTSIHYSRKNSPRNAKYWRRAMIAASIIPG